ncbi:MAG: rhodanese-like domain-containing protein [Flavobacteriales bacterium]|nr:rhodanese-like domain-containing protein [Flavobacteriales bacterium]
MDLKESDWRTSITKNDQAVIVDVRTPHEWDEGIIPGAIMLDIMDGPQFMETIRAWDKDKEYYVYCRSGNRSWQACRIMKGEGLMAYNLSGGIIAWQGEVQEPII